MPRFKDKDHSTRLGQRIRARRQWLELSQQEVGDKLDLTFQQVQKYENGSNDLSTGQLLRLAAVLKTTPNALLGLDEGSVSHPGDDNFAELMSNPSAASIVRRLKKMTDGQRKVAHAVLCGLAAGDGR